MPRDTLAEAYEAGYRDGVSDTIARVQRTSHVPLTNPYKAPPTAESVDKKLTERKNQDLSD